MVASKSLISRSRYGFSLIILGIGLTQLFSSFRKNLAFMFKVKELLCLVPVLGQVPQSGEMAQKKQHQGTKWQLTAIRNSSSRKLIFVPGFLRHCKHEVCRFTQAKTHTCKSKYILRKLFKRKFHWNALFFSPSSKLLRKTQLFTLKQILPNCLQI